MIELLLCIPLQAGFRVDGLREGEGLRAAEPRVEAIAAAERSGRVVDARSGLPVEGATVETWTEEDSTAGPGLVRVGSATTARDGGFRVRVANGEVAAEKVLVRAPGYLTFPGTTDDLDRVRLMPRPEWTWRVQVLDLADRPIPGARITSTYSCAHDVPAFDVVTGRDGIAELTEYGLQEHAGELRVRAPGFASRKYVPWSDVPADPAHGSAAIVRLGRQRGLHARVLARTGEPLADSSLLVIDGEGHHVPRTDGRGSFAIDASYAARSIVVRVLADEPDAHVFAGELPDGREVSLRVGANAWPADTPTGTLSLRSTCASVALFGEDGWATELAVRGPDPLEVEFPAGRVFVLVGETFGGFEPRGSEVELPAGRTVELALDAPLEPELEILTPPGEAERVLVQAGDRSIEVDVRDGRSVVHVPAGVELTVLSDGRATRRAVVPPIVPPFAGATTVDLGRVDRVLAPTRAQLASSVPRETWRVEVRAETAELTALGPGDPSATRLGPNAFAVELAVGYPAVLCSRSAGFAECWTSVTTGGTQASAGLVLHPTPLAALTFENETGRELTIVGPEADSLGELHPGPLSLRLALDDGRAGELSLELAPGERRTLRIRD